MQYLSCSKEGNEGLLCFFSKFKSTLVERLSTQTPTEAVSLGKNRVYCSYENSQPIRLCVYSAHLTEVYSRLWLTNSLHPVSGRLEYIVRLSKALHPSHIQMTVRGLTWN